MEVYVNLQSIHQFLLFQIEAKGKLQESYLVLFVDKIGRIGKYRPSKDKNFHVWRYYIEHEQIDGYWGKKNKVKKHRRCYLTNEQKNQIVDKLITNE